MSKKTIAQWFAEKVKGKEDVLGAAEGKVYLDNPKDIHYQLFQHGIVLSKQGNINKLSDLVCTYGKLFHVWWKNKDAEWLGNPLEDLFKKTDAAGHEIMVQRFENGVINCRSDGGNDVQWLSWHDWHAISHPKDNSDTHP